MKHTIQGKEINIHWEQGELIEKHDSGCAYYHVTGTDDNFKDYTGVGNYQSGELEDVTEIEKVSLPYKMLGENGLVIEVPIGSFNHKVIDMTFVCQHNEYSDNHTMVKLPSSGFKFLSLHSEMDEMKARQLGFELQPNKKCSCCPECGNKSYTNKNLVGDGFRQCDDKNCFQEWWVDIYYDKSKFSTAYLESYQSLIKSLGYVTENPLSFDPTGITTGEWQEAQKQVVELVILIKTQ